MAGFHQPSESGSVWLGGQGSPDLSSPMGGLIGQPRRHSKNGVGQRGVLGVRAEALGHILIIRGSRK